jgi:hypothetical protein
MKREQQFSILHNENYHLYRSPSIVSIVKYTKQGDIQGFSGEMCWKVSTCKIEKDYGMITLIVLKEVGEDEKWMEVAQDCV